MPGSTQRVFSLPSQVHTLIKLFPSMMGDETSHKKAIYNNSCDWRKPWDLSCASRTTKRLTAHKTPHTHAHTAWLNISTSLISSCVSVCIHVLYCCDPAAATLSIHWFCCHHASQAPFDPGWEFFYNIVNSWMLPTAWLRIDSQPSGPLMNHVQNHRVESFQQISSVGFLCESTESKSVLTFYSETSQLC